MTVSAPPDPSPHFRSLYDAYMNCENRSEVWSEVLQPWLETEAGIACSEWLNHFKERHGDPIPPASRDDLEALYALSRTTDYLTLRRQPPGDEENWALRQPKISSEQHRIFMQELGFTAVEEAAFHPFYHEIVKVDEDADAEAEPRLTEVYWQPFMLGPMLFSRGGVRVSSGGNHIRKKVAETSTMYWGFVRRGRRHNDLSHGWGSNSQWGTCLRRDYRFGDKLFLNVDAREERPWESGDGVPLSPDGRRDLLLHRCFVTRVEGDDDWLPYDLTGEVLI